MKFLYQINIDDYIKAYELAVSRGKKPGDSMEDELFEVSKESGNLKKLGATELTQDELMKDQAMRGRRVLSMETDSEKTKFKFSKPKETEDGKNL